MEVGLSVSLPSGKAIGDITHMFGLLPVGKVLSFGSFGTLFSDQDCGPAEMVGNVIRALSPPHLTNEVAAKMNIVEDAFTRALFRKRTQVRRSLPFDPSADPPPRVVIGVVRTIVAVEFSFPVYLKCGTGSVDHMTIGVVSIVGQPFSGHSLWVRGVAVGKALETGSVGDRKCVSSARV
jgi:hypothetical protein